MSHAYRSPLLVLTVLLIACSAEPPDVASAGSAGMSVIATGGVGGDMQPLAGTSAGMAAGSGGTTGSAGMSPIDMLPTPETDAGSVPIQDDAGDVMPEEDASTPAPCVKGAVTGSQVVFIGDSFIAAPTSNIAFELQTMMMQSGSTAYSATPRFRQLVGTTMAQISMQYDTEHQLNPDIKVVIGDGGGNDVLVTDRSCLMQAPPENAGCTATVDNALRIAEELMAKMERDGVEHFVYFFYPHEPLMGLFQGTAPAINDSLDYAEPRARAVCEASPICTFVSLSEAAGDSPGSGYVERGYINANDVHPSPEGSKFFANAIWDVMVERCIAQ